MVKVISSKKNHLGLKVENRRKQDGFTERKL